MSPRLRVERLEARDTPAVFAQPWADAGHLTLSLAPDGTRIGSQPSQLVATLGCVPADGGWQSAIFRAVQTWASAANLNVGVVADGGQPFGIAGAGQSDVRFGDIRIGARPMARSVLAVAVPPDPYLSGTWAGDIVLNSDINWADPRNNLYRVMLHEVGHALGLDENDDPTSAMYHRLEASPPALSADDTAAIRGLYGVRPPNANERVGGNGTPATATPLTGEGGRVPLVAFGDIQSAIDTDYFSLVVPESASGAMSVDVVTSGVSLLQPRVTVTDAAGNLLASQSSSALGGDRLRLTLPQVRAGERYLIQVEPAAATFAVGRYGVGVTFPAVSRVPDSQLFAVLAGPFDQLAPDEREHLFGNPQTLLIHPEGANHSTQATAVELKPANGYAARAHYDTLGSLADSADAVVYAFESPEQSGGRKVVLTAGLTAFVVNGVVPRVQLLRENGQPVPFDILAADAGRMSIQAADLPPGEKYYLKVFAAAGAGNYRLAVDFTQPVSLLTTYAAGNVGPVGGVGGVIYVAQAQLFHMVLSVAPDANQPGAAVRATIRDANGNAVWTLTVAAGDTASGSGPLLLPGRYTVTYEAVGAGRPLAFRLRGAALSDPVGPVVDDPTGVPMYQTPGKPGTYTYPNGTVSAVPFLWVFWVV